MRDQSTGGQRQVETTFTTSVGISVTISRTSTRNTQSDEHCTLYVRNRLISKTTRIDDSCALREGGHGSTVYTEYRRLLEMELRPPNWASGA